MTAYYVLQITDLSDPHNHRYSTVHPSNWDEGEGLVAAHAADNGYRLRHEYDLGPIGGPVYQAGWVMYDRDGVRVADAELRREHKCCSSCTCA